MRHDDARTLGIGVKVLGLRFLSIKAAAKHFNTTTYKIKFLVKNPYCTGEFIVLNAKRMPQELRNVVSA